MRAYNQLRIRKNDRPARTILIIQIQNEDVHNKLNYIHRKKLQVNFSYCILNQKKGLPQMFKYTVS